MDLSLLSSSELETIADPGAQAAVGGLLNLVERLVAENQVLRAEHQRPRDENNRLKGERGSPTFTAKRAAGRGTDSSSERERRQPKAWHKGTKLDRITIDRVERLTIDPATLPADATYQGTDEVVVQDLILRTDTILFEQEVWYSASEPKRYLAPLPAGYDGEFGPGLKALALARCYGANVSEPKLLELVRQAGVVVSSGWLATLLSSPPAELTAEAAAVEQAGLASTPWEHSDTTATRVDGDGWHCHVLSNALVSADHTLPKKDRLAVPAARRGGGPLTYRWNGIADAYLDWVGLSATARRRLGVVPREQELDEATLSGLLEPLAPWVGPQQRTWCREALALGAYRTRTDWPVVQTLLCDDAAQYRGVTDQLGLCWVHEGRHYTKLVAHVPRHQRLLDTVRTDCWAYDRELLAYRALPTPAEATRLERRFAALFGQTTGFDLLDSGWR